VRNFLSLQDKAGLFEFGRLSSLIKNFVAGAWRTMQTLSILLISDRIARRKETEGTKAQFKSLSLSFSLVHTLERGDNFRERITALA